MFPWTRIIFGLGAVLLGFFMVYKTNVVIGIFGRNTWAEKVFGPGGSRPFYKYIGIIVIVVGFIIITDLFGFLFGPIIEAIFGARPA